MSSITGKSIRDGIVIISTEGYFNKDLGEALNAVSEEEIKNGHKNFLINLENSKIVNSIGASILIEIIEKLQAVDGVMAFTNLAGIVEKTFNIMGITKYCEIYDSIDSGIEKLS